MCPNLSAPGSQVVFNPGGQTGSLLQFVGPAFFLHLLGSPHLRAVVRGGGGVNFRNFPLPSPRIPSDGSGWGLFKSATGTLVGCEPQSHEAGFGLFEYQLLNRGHHNPQHPIFLRLGRDHFGCGGDYVLAAVAYKRRLFEMGQGPRLTGGSDRRRGTWDEQRGWADLSLFLNL